MSCSRIPLAPLAYDLAQYASGYSITRARLRRLTASWEHMSVVDVGGGTGTFASVIPQSARYVCVDTDEAKLQLCRRKVTTGTVVSADATALPFDDGAFDCSACLAVAHHLDDQQLAACVDELARVTRNELLFLDPLAGKGRISRLLWALDRGHYPRPPDELLETLGRRFTLVSVEQYRIAHTYLMCKARPRHDANA